MSLERRMAEINPAAAQVGIYNERSLPSPKSKHRLKAVGVTGRLEVSIQLLLFFQMFHFEEEHVLKCFAKWKQVTLN